MKAYECPLCHNKYEYGQNAMDCLGKCVEFNEGVKYACPYCETIFDYRVDVHKCAAECWLKDNNMNMESIHIANIKHAGFCGTCANADENLKRLFPCPHRHDVKPPESCPQYDPDVRHFGMALFAEWQMEARP